MREIIKRLLESENPSRAKLNQIKIEVAREFRLAKIPTNSEIIETLTDEEVETLLPVLRRKESRALSGVNVIAVMTRPYSCPHGRCAYCPGGPEEDSPQSYTGYEPAAMRGSQNQYDPYRQVRSRISQLEAIGHHVDKVDLIIMGGTFPASPYDYQESFVKGCLDALNDSTSNNISEAKVKAETALIRNVGITVETRPDFVNEIDIERMLQLGVTRVELGVQNVYDDIYKVVDRGHTVEDVVDATRRLKDSAQKICYHMMPGLPGSTAKRDLDGFRTIFEDDRFKPDMIKIYPTLVIKGTLLYNWWKEGKYSPLNTDETVDLLARIKEITPPWVRIMRVQRDIPLPRVDAGVDKGNLRQLAKLTLEARGGRCRCIRCREVGHSSSETNPERIELTHLTYNASGGTEDFICAEDISAGSLVGFLRLRAPNQPFRKEINENTCLIRELHVYGRMVPVGQHLEGNWQHKGWGEALMDEAEKTASDDYDARKIVVMSALGTKQYYKRLGYEQDGPYVSKVL